MSTVNYRCNPFRRADSFGLNDILQEAGARIFKTDNVACPSCGRTLFNLQTTTAKIKAATSHLKGVKIAVMGCIVNGPRRNGGHRFVMSAAHQAK